MVVGNRHADIHAHTHTHMQAYMQTRGTKGTYPSNRPFIDPEKGMAMERERERDPEKPHVCFIQTYQHADKHALSHTQQGGREGRSEGKAERCRQT